MRIVTSAARRLGSYYVSPVEGEAFVGEDTVAVVTSVAQCVGRGGLDGEVLGFVTFGQEEVENRSVRPVGSAAADHARVVRVVTVGALDPLAS